MKHMAFIGIIAYSDRHEDGSVSYDIYVSSPNFITLEKNEFDPWPKMTPVLDRIEGYVKAEHPGRVVLARNLYWTK